MTLAYAVTAHGSQRLTVDTSHSLIDPATSRAGVYVPGTRGRDTSTFYVVCRHTADEHSPQGMDRSPRAVLTDILTRPDQASLAAELARREGLDEGRSLAWVGVPWDLLTTEYTRDRATDTLLELLGADTVDRVTAEAGYPRLIATVRAMELAGHDPAAVLTEAVRQASLHDAASVSDVLRYRIRRLDHTGRHPGAGGPRRGLDHLHHTAGRPGRRLRPPTRRGRDRAADRTRTARRRRPARVGGRRADPRPTTV